MIAHAVSKGVQVSVGHSDATLERPAKPSRPELGTQPMCSMQCERSTIVSLESLARY